MTIESEPTRRERVAARDAAEAERTQARRDGSANWGMSYAPDPRTASPERLAYEAAERGDRWFQIDMPIAYVQGYAHMGGTQTRTYRGEAEDVIGKIEQQGWTLEHVATTFIERGHASTKRMQMVVGTSADDVAVHGEMVGLYVFRRAQSSI